jgi:hypothetical protein
VISVVAFLQNQWFRDPDRVRALYARHAANLADRCVLNARFLFYRSRTGQNLTAAFGDLCDQIVWAEASPQIGGQSSSVFPADVPHMRAVLEHFQPRIVLGFGVVAARPLRALREAGASWDLVVAPHPTARGAFTQCELEIAARRLRELLDAPAPALRRQNAGGRQA